MCKKFYLCEKCGNLVEVVECGGGALVCCGAKMTALEANTKDASLEKHVPKVEISENVVNVCVGSIEHPMTEEHHISFIYLVTDKNVYRHDLAHTGAPKASFVLAEGESAQSVYEYCNLHGLWKVDL